MDMETRGKNGGDGATLPISRVQLVLTIIFLAGVIPGFVYYAYAADVQAMRESLVAIKGSIMKLDTDINKSLTRLDQEKVNKDVYELGMDFQNKKIDYLIDLTRMIIEKLDVPTLSKSSIPSNGWGGFKESSIEAKVD